MSAEIPRARRLTKADGPVDVRTLPKCEASIRAPYMTSRRRLKGNDCLMPAYFQIDGVNYCSRHGGLVALDLLCRIEEA